MKNRRLTQVLLTMAVGLFVIVGAAHAKTTVSFLHKWPEPENMVYFNAAVKAYEEANPEIEIKMEAVADEPYKDKIRVLMASGQVPDIYFSWSGEFGKKFARGGRALDITDAVYGSDWKDVFSDASLGPFKYKGKLYGIPINVNAKFMLYNTKLFAENNIEKPETFADLLDTCKKLVEAGVTPIGFGNQYPWAASHYIGELIGKLVPNDVRLADFELTRSADVLYTDPGYVEALNAFKALNDKGCFNRGSNALTHGIARGGFTAGRTAMMYMELTEFTEVKGTPLEKDGWDFFQLPGFTDARGDSGLITGAPDGFMISADTKNATEAIRFLKFLTSPEQGKLYVDTTGMTGAVKGSITSENADAKTLKGLDTLNAASGLALWIDTDMDARSTEVLLAGSQAILNGTETPEQVMAKVRKTAIAVKQEREKQ